MREMDEIRFKKLIMILREEYNAEFSAEKFKLWFELLKPYSIELIESAVQELIRTSQYVPKVAEIIKIILLTTTTTANAAWGELLISLRNSSAGENLITQQCVRQMGGAKYLASIDLRDLDFKKKNFLEIYAEAAQQNRVLNSVTSIRIGQSNITLIDKKIA